MSSIKINRALKASTIGSCPGSALDMLRHVPDEIVSALSGRQLGGLLDAMWRLAQNSKEIANREAVDSGCVWDSRHQNLLELDA